MKTCYVDNNITPSPQKAKIILETETACPIKAKHHVEHPWEGGTKLV